VARLQLSHVPPCVRRRSTTRRPSSGGARELMADGAPIDLQQLRERLARLGVHLDLGGGDEAAPRDAGASNSGSEAEAPLGAPRDAAEAAALAALDATTASSDRALRDDRCVGMSAIQRPARGGQAAGRYPPPPARSGAPTLAMANTL
jgi:hypothetical protein